MAQPHPRPGAREPRSAPFDAPVWTPELAARLAAALGMDTLSERHWCAIATCREEAARTGHAPGLRALSLLTGLTAKELGRLFPGSPATTIARLAGVSPPTAGEARARTGTSRRRDS